MRILVTGANGDIGEAVGRILREEFPQAQVVGADCAGAWPGRFVFEQVIHLPAASAPDYLDALRTAGRSFDLILPTSEPELQRLADSPGIGDELPLVMASPAIVGTFLDKYTSWQFFEREGVPAPTTRLVAESTELRLPLYLKPRRGAGGRGHRRVLSEHEWRAVREGPYADWVLQELLEDDANEFTCALWRFGDQARHIVLRRRLQGDRTVVAEVVRDERIDALLRRIMDCVALEGCINVQLRLTREGPRVLEINPRLSSTVMMRHRLGFQDCVWWVRSRLGLPIRSYDAPPQGTMVYRMSTEHVRPPAEAGNA